MTKERCYIKKLIELLDESIIVLEFLSILDNIK